MPPALDLLQAELISFGVSRSKARQFFPRLPVVRLVHGLRRASVCISLAPVASFTACSFEENWCQWTVVPDTTLPWLRNSSLHLASPSVGPSRDHSTNSREGEFRQVARKQKWLFVCECSLGSEWLRLQEAPLEFLGSLLSLEPKTLSLFQEKHTPPPHFSWLLSALREFAFLLNHGRSVRR